MVQNAAEKMQSGMTEETEMRTEIIDVGVRIDTGTDVMSTEKVQRGVESGATVTILTMSMMWIIQIKMVKWSKRKKARP